MNRITAGPITLRLEPDEEPYDEYPKVGIVAKASLTIDTGTDDYPDVHVIPLRSAGVWGIECPDLVAGCPIPDESWVIGDYGKHEVAELQAIIDALTNTGGA